MPESAGIPKPVDGTLDAAGATLAYHRYGPVDDAAIVLLHGARMDGRIWARAARELARAHGVVVPDLRGRGSSSCDPTVPASFVADTLLLIDRLELSRVHLVGHSMGGGVALELAWRLSQTNASPPLATLTLVAPTPTAGWQPGPGIIAFSQRMAELAEAGDREAAFELQLTHLWLADGRPRASLDEQAVQRARAVFLDNVDPPWPAPLEEDRPAQITDYARIDVPTLIVTGEADHPEVLDAAATLASVIPSASLTQLRGCGHDIPNERSDDLAGLILEHVTANPTAGS
jgi:pimeloyl-ACP methyl ester carboxylesterase